VEGPVGVEFVQEAEVVEGVVGGVVKVERLAAGPDDGAGGEELLAAVYVRSRISTLAKGMDSVGR